MFLIVDRTFAIRSSLIVNSAKLTIYEPSDNSRALCTRNASGTRTGHAHLTLSPRVRVELPLCNYVGLVTACWLTEVVGIEGVKVHPQAVTLNSRTEGQLYVHGRSDARHRVNCTRGRATERIQRTTFGDLLRANPRIDCTKMDIEGAELEILQHVYIPTRIVCMTVEYSSSVDPSMASFKRLIRRLCELFLPIEYPPIAVKRRSRVGNYVQQSGRYRPLLVAEVTAGMGRINPLHHT